MVLATRSVHIASDGGPAQRKENVCDNFHGAQTHRCGRRYGSGRPAPTNNGNTTGGDGMTRWLKCLFGLIFVVLGAVWTLQGLNVVQGSFMSGQTIFVAIGVVLALLGLWLLWSFRQSGGKVSVG